MTNDLLLQANALLWGNPVYVTNTTLQEAAKGYYCIKAVNGDTTFTSITMSNNVVLTSFRLLEGDYLPGHIKSFQLSSGNAIAWVKGV